MIRLKSRVVLLAIVAFLSVPALLTGEQISDSLYQQLQWRMIGPFRGGRTRAVSGVPSQPNVFYIGAVDGGVWKSDDYGRTWNPIFDNQPTQSIGAIAVAPSDPNTIYVASGEGLHRPDLSVGNGIYRSTDAGKTWTHLGLEQGQQIPALVVDPGNPKRLFAAVLGRPYGASDQRGIFRSTDGGESWQKVLYKDQNTGGSDVEIDPSNPNVIYASLWEERLGPWEDKNGFSGTAGGLFKSSDGGNTWKQLNQGLPKNLVQINVTVAPSQPNRLYATFSTTSPTEYASGKGLGFYRSDDGGETWYNPTGDPRPAYKIGGGDLPIPRVDPKNPDVVYTASLVTMKSTDGGKTWTSLRGAPGGDDYQNLWINPNDPKIILLVADQGALVTTNGGQTWSSWYNQPTAQLYHAIATNTFPYRVCGGQQESGSVCTLSRGNDGEITFRDWHPVGVIEYGYVAPDPLDPDVVYGAGRTEVSKFHWSTGQVQNITPIPIKGDYRADRTEPIMFSPLDPHTLFYAANVLFKTSDGGSTWQTISPDLTRENPGAPPSVSDVLSLNPNAAKQRGTIYSLAPSHKSPNTIWAGTDDGLIWITRDSGKNWTNITPKELTPWSKVSQIDASHFDDQTAYASVSRFRIDDLRPYIFRTHDGGKSWQLITTGLPEDAPVNTVREDPERKGMLFAGTESAVWISFDDGDHWQSLQLNLPHTSMRDLWIHDGDLILATHGRSFWILDDISPLRQLNGSTANAVHLFEPATAYRVRRSTNTDTPLPLDEPAGQNPPDGAAIDYYLPQTVSGPVTLEIADPQGKVVRRYSSADKPEVTEEELRKQVIPLYWIRMSKTLPGDAGVHRWVWDLHYTTPLSSRHEFPIAAVPHDTPRLPLGPLAVPGQYTVRLTAAGQTLTVPLTVRIDPRVHTPAEGIQQEFNLELRLANALTHSSIALLQVRSLRDQIQQSSSKASGAVAEAVKKFQADLGLILDGLAAPASGKPVPGLSAITQNISTLYGMVGQSDAAPTSAQMQAVKDTEHDLSVVMNGWDQFRKIRLPAMNRQLQDAGLPPVRLEMKPQAGESEGDEE
ncbi:MAG TPA: glycoside hydrolase [Terriglobales bacterium]|nr:glycoside hydrolase [Terriglobales bacterium]